MPKSNSLSNRYYEAHITVEAGHSWDSFVCAARVSDWRASKFDEDDVDDMSGSWFLSTRHRDLNKIKTSMATTLNALRANGYIILRWKIEDTILDSKHDDLEDALNV